MSQSRRTVLLWAALLVAWGLPMPAHSADTLSAAIPFKFMAGDQQFPSGSCTIDTSRGNKVSIRCGRVSALVQASALQFTGSVFKDPPRHEMIFTRYDKTYFLSQVWIGHQATELVKSDAEKELEANGAEGKSIALKIKK